MNKTLTEILSTDAYLCTCGKIHKAHLKEAIIESGAVESLPEYIKKYSGKKVYLVADENTMAAAGNAVSEILATAKIPRKVLILGGERAEPDEKAIGTLIYNFDYNCDIIVGCGTGVINDLCKILAKLTGLPYIIVATATSMDGFASSTSSIIRDGLKVSVDSKCPDVIIADTNILCKSPYEMILAGFGDMIAKYVSICEWRIGNLVTGEYYCEVVADMMRSAVKKIVQNANGLKNRDEKAISAVMEGLILSGIAADFAGCSRPASGVEHYYSHLWDMRHLEFNTPWSLHGIQCGVGTLLALEKYSNFVKITPNHENAKRYIVNFDKTELQKKLENYLGKSSAEIVKSIATSDKYDCEKHSERLDNIVRNFDKIRQIIDEELPQKTELEALFENLNAPTKSDDFGIPSSENDTAFSLTKDIRDKYILSTMMSDLGIL